MSERLLPPARRERSDVSLRSMLALLAFIGGVVVLMLLIAWWLYPASVADRRFAQPFPDYPAPRLQPSPRADMERFRAEQERALDGVYWRDRAAGTVHVPIDRAMALVARDGVADWPKAAPAGTAGWR